MGQRIIFSGANMTDRQIGLRLLNEAKPSTSTAVEPNRLTDRPSTLTNEAEPSASAAVEFFFSSDSNSDHDWGR